MNFAKFLLGTFALGLVSTLINGQVQQREIELKEQEQVGEFLDHALNIRFQEVELVKNTPSKNELRYYRRSERAIAETIQQYLMELGVDVSLGYVRGYENSNAIRPYTFEIWFSEQGL